MTSFDREEMPFDWKYFCCDFVCISLWSWHLDLRHEGNGLMLSKGVPEKSVI